MSSCKKISKKAEKETVELRRKKEKDIERELEKIKLESEKTAKEIELKSQRNFDKAVDYVIKVVLEGI